MGVMLGPGLCPIPTQGVNVNRQSDHTSLSRSGAIGQRTEREERI